MTPLSAHDYALIAQEAYTAAPDIGVESSASRAIVRDTPGGLVVAFPGTDNAACFIADMDAIPMAVPGVGEVHRGFWLAWQTISVPVLAAVNGRPVTFVGHSLGAAIAIMAAVESQLSGIPPASIYGFGPPRVAPSCAVRALLAPVPTRLFRNGNDLVPNVPLAWKHAGVLEQIGTQLYPFPNVEDHRMARYVAAAPTSSALTIA
jgi:hypothetical protein